MTFCRLIANLPRNKDPFGLAMQEAYKGLGFTHPNPPVGCVIVKEGQVIATGFHAKAGELHAEARALQEAGESARGADLYVTLEPCNHFGRTPPCAQAIIKAGIKRVFYGAKDPNPKVAGGGAEALRSAGVEVSQVFGEQLWQAEALIEPFKTLVLKKRPYVLAKIATSLDGKIAFEPGQSTALTGTQSQKLVHEWREIFDCVGVGAKTDQVDQPKLTARFADREARRQPQKVVFHSHQSLEEQLLELGRQGMSSIVVEGGGVLLTALLKAGLVDELAWFTAPKIIGNQGVPAILDLEALKDYTKEALQLQLGVDFLNIV